MKCSLHCKKDIVLTASGQYVSVLASCSHLSVCLQFDHLHMPGYGHPPANTVAATLQG